MSPPNRALRTGLILAAVFGIAGLVVWYGSSRRDAGRARTSVVDETPRESTPVPMQSPESVSAPRAEIAPPPKKADELRIRVSSFTTHEPIANASLEFTALDETLDGKQLVTGSDGVVSCPVGAADGARAKIRADGYCPIVEVFPNAVHGAIEIQLAPAGTIRVRVLDEKRVPAAGAHVTAILESRDIPRELRTTLNSEWPDFYRPQPGQKLPITDAGGEYVIERMPCGVPIVVSASGPIPRTSVETTIDPARREQDIELVAAGKRCLHGRLVWESGAPVHPNEVSEGQTADFKVWALDDIRVVSLDKVRPADPDPKAYIEQNGEFRLCDLPLGRVNWRVDWPGEYTRCTTIEGGVAEVGDIVLHRGAICRGRVYLTKAPKDFSYSGIRLDFVQNGRIAQSMGDVRKDGRFEARLLAGIVRIDLYVAADRIDSLTRELPCDDISICLDPYFGSLRITSLDLDPHEKPYLKLEDVAHEFRGTWDRPVVGHQYALGGIESVIKWVGGDLCAWFLTPGTYDVYAGIKSQNDVRCAGRAVIRVGEECVIDASKTARGSIRGLVRTEAGRAVAGTTVMACPKSLLWSHLYKTTIAETGEEGEFVFPAAVAGEWVVFPNSRGPSSPEAQTVEVVPGAETRVTLTIETPGGVEGTVKRRGVPANGGAVNILPAWEIHAIRTPPTHHIRLGTDGHFKLMDLAPGRYGYSVHTDFNTPQHRYVAGYFEVRAGETTTCDIDLDFDLTVLRITRDGAPAPTFDLGFVAGPGGVHQLERMSDSDATWGAKLSEGPCLFFFQTKDTPIFDYRTTRGFLVAAVAHAMPSAREMNVDITGATLVVRRATEDAEMPRAYLESTRDAQNVAEWFAPANLASTDEGSTRRFPCLPVGSTVVLETNTWSKMPLLTKRVTVTSSGEIEVAWPPN